VCKNILWTFFLQWSLFCKFDLLSETLPWGVATAPWFSQISGTIVTFCFERRYPKQNSVIRLKSNICAPRNFWPLPNFWACYAVVCSAHWLWWKAITIMSRFLSIAVGFFSSRNSCSHSEQMFWLLGLQEKETCAVWTMICCTMNGNHLSWLCNV